EYYYINKSLILILLLIKNLILSANKILISDKKILYYILRILQTKLAPTNKSRKHDIIK
ncbi:hypothetical protein P170DRAFT_360261, partial [Aspergillus steynii IBT 23096]